MVAVRVKSASGVVEQGVEIRLRKVDLIEQMIERADLLLEVARRLVGIEVAIQLDDLRTLAAEAVVQDFDQASLIQIEVRQVERRIFQRGGNDEEVP